MKQQLLSRLATHAAQRRVGIAAMTALASIALCGATAPTGCTPPPPPPSHPGTEVAAAVGIVVGVSVGTVILVELHHSHHTIEGCVTASRDGLQVMSLKDKKTYALSGATASTKVGDVVRLHGNKEKTKDANGDGSFVVEKMTRDFGPCKLTAPAADGAGTPPATGGDAQ